MRSRPARIAFLVLAALYSIWASVFIFHSSVVVEGKRYFCLFDDAMISMRYAWNLAHGAGLVWNAGERIEGITNLLMTLFMTPAAAVLSKSAAVLAVQIAGIGFMLGAAWIVVRIRRAIGAPSSLSDIVVAAATLAYYPLSFWSLMGMETGLLAVLMLSAVWLSLRDSGRFQPWVAVLVGLGFLTRPDAALQGSLILLFHSFSDGERIRVTRAAVRRFAGEAAIFAGIISATTLFRLLYYGAAVPNTYTLKVAGWLLSNRLSNGVVYIRPFLASTWPAIAIGTLGFVASRSARRGLLLGCVLSVVAYQVWVGGDPWFYWRILAPYVPLAWILAGEAFADLNRRVEGSSELLRRGLPATCMAVFVLFADYPFWDQLTLTQRPYTAATHNDRDVRFGLELARVCRPDASIGVVTAGAIPYYAGARGVDFLGKCDKHIATLTPDLTLGFDGLPTTPGHNKYDLHYSIEKLQPDVLQLTAWGHDNVTSYVIAHYVGYHDLWFRRNSPRIRWELIGMRP